LLPLEKAAPRIAEEAITLLLSSGDTGARVLTVAMYYVHQNPDILQQLRAELNSVMPKATDIPAFSELLGLPWLVSTIWSKFHDMALSFHSRR